MSRPLAVAPATLTAAHIGTTLVVGTLLALGLVGLPAWAVARGWLPQPPAWASWALLGAGASLGYGLALSSVAWHRAQLTVLPTALRVRFPFRLWRRQVLLPYLAYRQLRFGPDDHNRYYLMAYPTHSPNPALRREIRIDVAEEAIEPVARELEALGLSVVVWEEL